MTDDSIALRESLGRAPTPDHNTLWRFHEDLARRGPAERLVAAVTAQLAAEGMLLEFHLSRGRLSMRLWSVANVAAANQRRDGRPVDRDARWTKRGRRSLQGYKAHVAIDHSSGRVRDLAITGSDVHDSRKGWRARAGGRAWSLCAQGLRDRRFA